MKHVGRLGTKDEKIAQAVAYPSAFGELVLGYKFHPKQKKALDACRFPGTRVTIAAGNGTGKTSRILPTLVLWHQYLWPAGKVKVTSGSYTQVEDQIYPNIEVHKNRFPKWHWLETPFFESMRDDGRKGFFRGFTTNDPGKAEGDHEDGPDCPLLFIVDEAKTCPMWLKKVLTVRVRPTRLILMSSHGFAEGWFWETHKMTDGWDRHNISVDDCPHISAEEIAQIDEDCQGEPDFANAAKGYDFIPLVQDAVIDGKAFDECMNNPPKEQRAGEIHAFCDFAWSGGGNENVLAVRRGNVVSIEACFKCDHLKSTPMNPSPGIVDIFIAHFSRLGLEGHCISGDEGSGGRLVMDELDSRRWFLTRVNNQDTATDSDRYGNIGAEMWYNAGKLVTAMAVVLPKDKKFRVQALSRKRKVDKRGKLIIESKEEMKEDGRQSPDVADAVFGCMMPKGGFGTGAISFALPMAVGRYQTMGG